MRSKKTVKSIGMGLGFAICLAWGVTILLVNSATAPPVSDQFDNLRVQIQETLIAEKVPSLAVAVSRGEQVVWQQAFGWADLENRIRASESTMYCLGSVSKPNTATALMVLVEQGVVGLDQPVNKYLGKDKLQAHIGNEADATVRRLANHTSGLTRHSQLFYSDEVIKRPPMSELIRRYGHLLQEPGQTYEYSNFGYGVLSYLIERASGKSFAQFMQEAVFLPLDMTHTAVGRNSHLEKNYAINYGEGQTRIPPFESAHPGASDVYSCTQDMIRFGRFHLKHLQVGQKQILQNKHIELMQQPDAKIDSQSSYGIGWYIDSNYYGYRRIYHTGHTGYTTASLMLFPDQDICIVALANSSTDLPVRVSQWILARLLPDYAKRLKEQGRLASQEQTSPYIPAPEWVGQWSGNIETYKGKSNLQMWFEENGEIYVQMQGQNKTYVSGARIQNGNIRGSFNGDIGTEDANRYPYNLHFKLRRRDDLLYGSITATSQGGRRVGSVLSHWLELKRVKR
jgi:CubicO group peptidase (beta-lactamase class C family)